MNKPQLTRTCSICGLQKPLAAFLQVSSTEGTGYGNICATCRGAGMKEKSLLKEDERSSTTSGVRIGAKQKLEIDKEIQRLLKAAQEAHEKKLKKREKTLFQRTEHTELKEKDEKKHRTSFLEKKQSFLRFQVKTPNTKSPAIQQNINSSQNPGPVSQEIQKKHAALQHDQIITSIDFAGPPILGPQHSDIRWNNPFFEKFKIWLGESAPLMRTMGQLYKKAPSASKEAAPQPDPLHDYIDKTWGPGSRKK